MNAFDIAADNAIFAGRELPAISWDSVRDVEPVAVVEPIGVAGQADYEDAANRLAANRKRRVDRMSAVMPDNERDQESFLIELERQGKQLTDFA